jgi:outer membrane lipoprotein-sorting protein
MAKRVGTVWLLLILTATGGYSQQRETVSAQEILDRMFGIYASCSSYTDKGEVKQAYKRGGVAIKRFTTAFVRPGRFRFEFTEENDQRFVIWRDESSIRSWWSIGRQTKYYETLGQAVGNTAGVTGGSSVILPSMLFQNLGDSRRLQTLTGLRLVAEEKVGRKAAYRIEGVDWTKRSLTVWVDKENFLLLRLFEKIKDVEKTVTFEPAVNAAVPPEKLAFKH